MTEHTDIAAGFQGLGIAPEFLEILEKIKYTVPTPIQHQAIPVAVEGKDIVGIAQTGTGKTLAFGVPMLQRLFKYGGLGLIVVPTRELAIQVDETIQKIGRPLGVMTAVLIGGESIHRQTQALRRKPNVIIATPGRLLDHIEQKNVRLDPVKILVLDEADRMFDIGFAPQIKRICALVPKERQTMLFSATMPHEIMDLAKMYMALPVRIEVAPAGTAAERVEQEIFLIKKEERITLLQELLGQYKGTVLVFSRTKHGARKICIAINQMGHKAAEIHSNRSLGQRREALSGFKTGKYRILVATDIAARGIDVNNIQLVINFDLPDNTEDYVHRIGRTARAGKEGKAISFAMPDQKRDVRDIERLIRKELPVIAKEGQKFYAEAPAPTRRFGGSRHFPRRRR
jgi:ATP-dependent RNA helicase RhlE